MRRLFDFSKAAFWIGLIFILYIFAILTNETGKNYTLRAKSDELEVQIEQLQSQIEELGYKVTYYKTDSYQDKLAREKLGLQKPGETVVIIKKDSSLATSSQVATEQTAPTQTESSRSHWQQWRDFLFGS
ncbi:septum formation initiator family protein [Candidatus Saccharibacteria bacterium]|nr:septum formation initiator family protein [Candidatus Saccharibacteria bacterium]